MANKKITDLMSGTPARDSLFESAIDISGTMDSRKVTAGAIADLASANVAAPYNSATTYAIGQYCLREGNIYRCIAITTGTFDATKWTQIVVTSEFRRVVELTTAQYEALSSAEQNNGTLYVLTDGIPPSETVTGSDIIPFIDVSDSNAPKSTTAAAVAGLAVKVIQQTTFNAEQPLAADTELNSSTPVAINNIPTGYKVIGILNQRCYGYFGSRMIGYAWLSDSTHYNYAIYNAGSRNDAKVNLDVWFLCVPDV